MIRFKQQMFLSIVIVGFLFSCSGMDVNNNSNNQNDTLPSEEEMMSFDDGSNESKEMNSQADQELGELTEDNTDLNDKNLSGEKSLAEDFQDGDYSNEGLEQKDGSGEKSLALESKNTAVGEDVDQESFLNSPSQSSQSEPLPLEGNGSNARQSINIENIKFLANRAGGTVVIEANGPINYKTRTNESNRQFVVEIANANLPSRLKRPYIMKEFSGQFAAINAYQNSNSTTARVVIQMRQAGKALVQEEGNSLLVLPPTSDNLAASVDDAEEGEILSQEETERVQENERNEPAYDTAAADRDEQMLGAKTFEEYFTGNNKFYGRRLSIQTKDADLRDTLNFIAEFSGVNLIISDDVTGTISLKLREVPWDQALVTIMRSKKLGYVRQGNVIRISTLGTLQSESDSARAILESQKSLTPLRVKVIPVSYANVDNLVKQLEPFLSEKRGKIVFDNRTTSLIITDTEEVIGRVVKLVKNLDIPPMQVMIEGKIVEATEEFQRSVGVNWSFDGEKVNLSPSGGVNGGPLDLRASLGVSPVARNLLTANPMVLDLTIGRLDFLGELGAILSLAETETMVKVLSSPRVVAINKEPALITQEGQVITKSTITDLTGNKKTTIERTPVTLNLTVVPQITSVGSVILDVNVKRQFAGGVVDTESLARPINTREAKTKVLVGNGQTAVIGGVYQSDTAQGETGVPGLRNIPVLGWLFKNRQRNYEKNELLIFLTPRIIHFGESDKQEKQIENS